MKSVLEQYLRCYINYQQDSWDDLLPFAEVAYNNSVLTSMGFTPFQGGQDFNPIPKLPLSKPRMSSLKEWVTQLHSAWPIVRKLVMLIKSKLARNALNQKPLMSGIVSICLPTTCSHFSYQKSYGPNKLYLSSYSISLIQ